MAKNKNISLKFCQKNLQLRHTPFKLLNLFIKLKV